jgi:hypothetical protein
MFKSNNYDKNKNTIIEQFKDYMFTSTNIDKLSKHIIKIHILPNSLKNAKFKEQKPKNVKNIVTHKNNENVVKINENVVKINENKVKINENVVKINENKLKINENVVKINENKLKINETIQNKPMKNNETIQNKPIKNNETNKFYKPKQKDTLFWCFYILKHGYSNYEMEINNQYFQVEKNEKYKYIDILRQNKDKLKIHKIKPLTELEEDLAHNQTISIKTFFALCVVEDINVMLVDRRKIYELTFNKANVNVIHRNKTNDNYSIEIQINNDILNDYRNNYYIMPNFDSKLKSVSAYKSNELLDLCYKFNIDVDNYKNDKKKLTKNELYELLLTNF